MQINTRFNIEDRVWTIHRLKAVEFEIHSISISSPRTLMPIVRTIYCGTSTNGTVVTAPEDECFTSKDELLKHITDNGNQEM